MDYVTHWRSVVGCCEDSNEHVSSEGHSWMAVSF